MKKILFLFLILFGFGMSYAVEIKGAFGIKFGEVLDKINIIQKSETDGGEPLYIITPPKKVKILNYYAVMVTPKTKKVYSIWGMAFKLKKEECETNLKAIASILEKKYKIHPKKPTLSFDEAYILETPDIKISLRCTGFMDYDLYVQYYHKKLQKQAEKEAIELKQKSVESEAF